MLRGDDQEPGCRVLTAENARICITPPNVVVPAENVQGLMLCLDKIRDKLPARLLGMHWTAKAFPMSAWRLQGRTGGRIWRPSSLILNARSSLSFCPL